MSQPESISDLPRTPAVYALFGGTGRSRYVAYVGIAKDLRSRITQHLVLRDSSVATGTTAACLNADYVTELCWWRHQRFRGSAGREAGELVAYDVLNPALRSRGGVPHRAKDLYAEKGFFDEMTELFENEPTGRLLIPTLQSALERVTKLEKRVKSLETLVERVSKRTR